MDTEHFVRPEQLALNPSFPFNTTAPRQLPWDFSKTRIQNPKKSRQNVELFHDCERQILEQKKLANYHSLQVSLKPGLAERDIVEFWIHSMIGFQYEIREVLGFGTAAHLQNLQENFDDLNLFLTPCGDVKAFSTLPRTMPLYRFIKNVSLLKCGSFWVCAASLGKQAMVKSGSRWKESLKKKAENGGFDSIWFCEKEAEWVMVLNSQRIVPLYGFIL
jgi:hypothetical protein